MATVINACPNCNTALPRGAAECPRCKLEVSRMEAFAAAKRAAAKKGLQATTIESHRIPFYRHFLRPAYILPLLALIAVIYFMTRPAKPPAWTQYPRTQEDAARTFLSLIAAGDNKSFDRAYAMIPPAARNPQDTDELGHYRQLFTTMHNYLVDEFGSDWLNRLKIDPPANPEADSIEAHIDMETLHVRTSLQTPPEKRNDTNLHYAVTGVDEFNIGDAAELQKAGLAKGVLRGYGAEGSIRDLEAIRASMGGNRRETTMQTKLRLLPNLRDPRSAVRRAVLQTWPVRKDPVIRAHLEQMSTDGRFAPDVQQTAKEVLQNAVPEEDLIAAGVTQTY